MSNTGTQQYAYLKSNKNRFRHRSSLDFRSPRLITWKTKRVIVFPLYLNLK